VDLPGGAQKQLVIYVAMDRTARELRISLDAKGASVAEQTVAIRPRVDERMLGIVAGQDPRLSLPRRQDLASLAFTSLTIAPADLPDRAAGLGSLGLLLIHDLAPDSLSQAQVQALLAWVSAGGHLIIGGGTAARPVGPWLPASLQAATLGAATQIGDGPLADLSGAPGPGALPAVALTALPGGVSVGPPAAPAWVSRSFGSGKVTQLAFDPGLPAMQAWAGAPDFWNALLQPALLISTPLGQQTSPDSIQDQILAGALTALPTIRQPPVDQFFLALVVYTILVGPVLALGLRRIDRQSWSWLIVPVAAIGCGSLLMTLALNLRASSQVVTQVGLVEYLGGGQARARSYVGVLSPQSEMLPASLPAGALAHPVLSTGGLYGSIDGVGGDLAQESDSLNLSVDAWQFQGVAVDQQIALPDLAATITIDDQGAMAEVHNTTGQRLLDVVAVYGSWVLRLGDMAPDDKVTGRWAPRQSLSEDSSISALVFEDAVAEASQPGRARNRRIQIQQALIDAAVTRGPSRSDIGPLVLAWVERSPLNVSVHARNAASQSVTLLVAHPHIQASGTISLPPGWLRVDPELSRRSTCVGVGGTGILASPAPATITMRLPGDLAPLKVKTITLNLDSTNKWPSAGVTTELYDWAKGAWVEQSFDGPGDLAIANAGPFLFEGRLMLRLTGTIERAGCLSVTARLSGSMP
jgi:hypothetical protein